MNQYSDPVRFTFIKSEFLPVTIFERKTVVKITEATITPAPYIKDTPFSQKNQAVFHRIRKIKKIFLIKRYYLRFLTKFFGLPTEYTAPL